MADEPLLSVLVTGGNSFVGYHIVSRILDTEPTCHLSIIDLPTPLPRFPTVTYYDVDVTSKTSIQEILRKTKPRVIFHTACTYSLSLPPSTFSQINTQGTINVLEAAQSLETVKAFIYHSSSSVIEDGTSSVINASESFPILLAPHQKFPYPLSKALAESFVLSANRKHGILTTSIRPAGAFGEADTETMQKLIGNAKSGRANVQIGDGQNVFDFVYIGNLVHAHLLAAKALLRDSKKSENEVRGEDRVDGQAFHITNDEPWLFWQFTRAVAKAAGYPVKENEIRAIPRWVAMLMAFFAEWFVWIFSLGRKESNLTRYGVRYSTMTRTLNIQKAKRVLAYRPIFTMEEGIERSVAWFDKEEKKTQ
jgi:sterol-4alpha-carboxylate 3-dehydrogenase (decarboxylating)